MKTSLDLYSDYLLSSTCQTSATGLSLLLDNAVSHDSVSRFLSRNAFDSKTLWLKVKPLVREHESDEGCLVFDDMIQEKPYTDESDLICYHYDHCVGQSVKGINLLTAFYVSQKTEDSPYLRVPVSYELIQKPVVSCTIANRKENRKSPKTKNELMRTMIATSINNRLLFKYILADSWFGSAENMRFIEDNDKYFIFDMKENRLAILCNNVEQKPDKKSQWTNINELPIAENTPVLLWLKDLDFPVLLVKQVFKDENGNPTGCRFLLSNNLNLSYNDFATIYKKRWGVEEYHKSVKQNASFAKSPARTIKTQTNHIFSSIWAYVKLEKLKFQTQLNHFQIKAKLYLNALKAAFAQLALLQEKTTSA
jgi:hypothetical protein